LANHFRGILGADGLGAWGVALGIRLPGKARMWTSFEVRIHWQPEKQDYSDKQISETFFCRRFVRRREQSFPLLRRSP
jgi:hypothetical protein